MFTLMGKKIITILAHKISLSGSMNKSDHVLHYIFAILMIQFFHLVKKSIGYDFRMNMLKRYLVSEYSELI